MDAVALAAGVGKATISRRWSSKAELLLSVMDVVGAPVLEVPDTGKLREDLVAVLTGVVGLFGGPSGRAIRSLLGAVIDDPVLQEGCRRLPLANWDSAWRPSWRARSSAARSPPAPGSRSRRRSARRCSRCAGWAPGGRWTTRWGSSWATQLVFRCCDVPTA